MDKKLKNAINDQIKNELYSGYLYLSMAAYFEARNLAGFGHWMKVQAKEEQGHAMKMFNFLVDRGVQVVLQAIPQPPADFSSPQAVFEQTLEHEKKVTALIEKLCDLSEETD
ncbi:MAG: ferritin, partial [Candidatus Omnitrophota bacterium]